MCVCVCVCVCVCKYYYCVMCIWFMRHNDMTFWDYEIVIEIEYKCQVKHALICKIHVNMWLWIVTLWDIKLWTWNMVVNKYLVNTLYDITCELYNNLIGVYLEKSVYARGVKRNMWWIVTLWYVKIVDMKFGCEWVCG